MTVRIQKTPYRLATVLYAIFVVYGSLVPLEYRDRAIDEAWRTFLETPYYQLGVASRADWVANILLYIPLAFFAMGWFTKRMGRASATLIVFAISVAIAFAVEFAQLFFPPRTVSLNDLIAETIGSALGVLFWHTMGDWFSRLCDALAHGGDIGVRALITLYSAGYVTYSLFPFDFLISARELAEKLTISNGLLFNPSCGPALRCGSGLLFEILIVMPLGVFLGMLTGRRRGPSLAAAFAWGAALGLLIEVLQVFLASGISQGLSILTRGIGVAAGLGAYRRFRSEWLIEYRAQAKVIVIAAIPLYLVVLMAMSGFFVSDVESVSAALAKLRQVHFMPFYYHYFTSEQEALHSLLLYGAAYAPLGAAVWVFKNARAGLWTAASCGFLVAAAMEALKLFLTDKRPDPTDALIGAAAAALAWWALERLTTRPASAKQWDLKRSAGGLRLSSSPRPLP